MDPQLKQLLGKAKGVFLVPEFGRGAVIVIVGGRGGAGLVLAKDNGQWSDPAFYDFGAISLGAQAGGSGGKVAFLLMTDKAVDAFKSGNKISLNSRSRTYDRQFLAQWASFMGRFALYSVSICTRVEGYRIARHKRKFKLSEKFPASSLSLGILGNQSCVIRSAMTDWRQSSTSNICCSVMRA